MILRTLAGLTLSATLLAGWATTAMASPARHHNRVYYGWSEIVSSSGACLTGAPASAAIRSKPCTGGANQKWHFTLDGSIVLQYGSEQYCLDDAANANPLKPQLRLCNDGTAQHWTWVPYTGELTGKNSEASLPGTWTFKGNGFPGYAKVAGPVGISGTNMTIHGKIYVPVGINVSAPQFPYGQTGNGMPGTPMNPWYLDGAGNPLYTSMVDQAEAQISASVNDWHANTVRLAFQQDELVNPVTGAVDTNYLRMLQEVVSYAKSKGLVVIITDQTEAAAQYQVNEPLPTADTESAWDQLIAIYGSDKSVIIDPFNEPRDINAGSESAIWNYWLNGGILNGTTYIGFNQLIAHMRASGAQNMLWVETPFGKNLPDQGLGNVVWNFSQYHVTDPDNLVAYAFHHPTTNGNPRTVVNWNAQFATVVRVGHAPVVDDEWTNYTLNNSVHVYPNGDSGQCWGDAPSSVPAYLTFLQNEGIGLLGWTLGTGSVNNRGFLNADSGDLGSTTSYGQDFACQLDGPTEGAGADLQAWFANLNP